MTRARLLALAAIGVVAVVAVVAALALTGGEEPEPPVADATATASDTGARAAATPTATVEIDESLRIPLDSDLVDAIAADVGDLPSGSGDTDRDRIASLIGPPDVFAVSYEVVGGEDETSGDVVRYETWTYYTLASAFEFADGLLVSNLPVEDVAGPSLLPTAFQPDQFRRETTWAEVAPLLGDADETAMTEVPAELLEGTGTELTAYAAAQLLVVFDQDGLVYAETFPLEPEAGE